MSKWMVAAKKADFYAIAQQYHISPVMARIIRNRDVIEEADIRKFLHGTRQDLYAPDLLKDMDKAVDILLDKIAQNKQIRIIGDYDIDGVNASFILLRGLRRCHANADVEIPDRMKDGYGINETLIEGISEHYIRMLIAQGKIKAFRTGEGVHGKYLVNKESLLSYFSGNEDV